MIFDIFWLTVFWIVAVLAMVCIIACISASVYYCATSHRRQMYRLRRFTLLNYRTGESERYIESLDEESRPFNDRSASAIISGCRVVKFRTNSRSWARRNCRNDVCAICIDDFLKGEKVVVCPCKHGYHKECLRRWVLEKNSCPLCFKPISKLYYGAV